MRKKFIGAEGVAGGATSGYKPEVIPASEESVTKDQQEANTEQREEPATAPSAGNEKQELDIFEEFEKKKKEKENKELMGFLIDKEYAKIIRKMSKGMKGAGSKMVNQFIGEGLERRGLIKPKK